MNIVEVKDIEQLRAHQDQWNALLAHANDSSAVFITPAWIISWWQQYQDGKELCLLLLFDEDVLVGIAPFAVYRHSFLGVSVRAVRFLGSGQSDHIDLYVHPDFREQGLPELVAYLATRVRWHVLDLIDLPEDSPTLALLPSILEQHGLRHSIERTIVCPYMRIEETDWPRLFAAKRSKSTRADLRRRSRRLGELGEVAFRRHVEPDDILAVFPKLFELYEKRWQGKNLSIGFAGKRERLFYPEAAVALAARDALDLVTLELDGRVLAFSLGAAHGRRFTWLITAYDADFGKYFPGELMLTHILEQAVTSGEYDEFDFTRGEEDYKYKWAEHDRYNVRLVVANRSVSNLVPMAVIVGYTVLRREAKRSKFLRYVKLELLGSMKAMLGRVKIR